MLPCPSLLLPATLWRCFLSARWRCRAYGWCGLQPLRRCQGRCVGRGRAYSTHQPPLACMTPVYRATHLRTTTASQVLASLLPGWRSVFVPCAIPSPATPVVTAAFEAVLPAFLCTPVPRPAARDVELYGHERLPSTVALAAAAAADSAAGAGGGGDAAAANKEAAATAAASAVARVVVAATVASTAPLPPALMAVAAATLAPPRAVVTAMPVPPISVPRPVGLRQGSLAGLTAAASPRRAECAANDDPIEVAAGRGGPGARRRRRQ